ncbi:MAG: hypothetical protein E3J72_19050 [Planctomycetota bacterium]|nr:MAG: hypothetical protein E3J72_19050 [Planctomycetota bacterium]
MLGKIGSTLGKKHIELKFSGKLTGHMALNCFSMLRDLARKKEWPIVLDLRECTSIDSIGVTILEWVRTQNGRLNVQILHPALDLGEKDFVSVKLCPDWSKSGRSESERRPAV